MQIDYVRTILNLNRTDDNWQLNPRMEFEGGPPRGTGNQVSAEFNLVYRWHAATSTKDDAWTRELFKEIVEGPLHMTAEQAAEPKNINKFLGVLGQVEAKASAVEPNERPFPALKAERLERIKEGPFAGNFEDNDIAKILVESIEDCANAMGPQQVPTVMKAIEVLGIKQARTWKLATLNEFRKHFALEPHKEFSDITENVEVQEALKHLYGTPDNVELYPGLVVEDAKRPMLPGSGLCPSYTVSRGVLSDATALVRGDRFYTTSYTPAAMTNWGFQEASSDLSIDNGCVMYKLFLRALPNNFDPASVYVHYPMTVPQGQGGMIQTLERLEKAQKYDMERPKPISPPVMVFSYDAANKILHDQESFKVTWGKAMEFLMGAPAKNFMLAGDGPKNAESRKLMEKALYQGGSSRAIPQGNEKWLTAVRTYYEDITTKLLKEKSYNLAGVNQVDIIRDVGNLAHVHFGAELFSLPLKTKDFPRGVFTEHQLYLIMAAVFICIFFDVDPPKSFNLRQQAHEATQQLGNLVQIMVQSIKITGKIGEDVLSMVMPPSSPLRDYGVHMIAQLVKADPSVSDLVWGNVLGTCGGMTANQGQLFAQALDYFFTDGKQYLPEIHRLAHLDTPAADDELMHYLMEATRLSGETGVFRCVTEPITITDKTAHTGSRTLHLKPGDKVMVNLKAASRDPIAFPNPDTLDLNRPLDSYIHLGAGAHQCLGLPMTRVALTTMLKVIGRLDGLRSATVAVGTNSEDSKVKKVLKEFVPGDLAAGLPAEWHYHAYLTEDWDMFFPFPQSLQINFDGKIPEARKAK
nr:psi-producing oxygenase a [Quercus suber]